jgi:ATPase subunit of ABC transporter with duplicated ATPase domains
MIIYILILPVKEMIIIKKDYTIYDIATEAGVSIATVSRVLNHPDQVNKKTRKHIESKISVLSGGEKSKVRLCKLLNRESNILVFDEPTNHLDVDAKAELKRALKSYKGSILLISHEPEFYQDVVTDIWDVETWTTKAI